MTDQTETNDAEEPKANSEAKPGKEHKDEGNQPHDALFHDGMSRPQIYEAFFDQHLPEHIKRQVVPGTIKPINTKMVDRRLRELRTDTNMSTAQKLIDQGNKEGRCDFLITFLSKKFGDIPDWVYAKLEKATNEMLEAWFSATFEKDRIEDVFA